VSRGFLVKETPLNYALLGKTMKRFLIAAALALASASPSLAQTPSQALGKDVFDSVYILYTQDIESNMRMTCTATAYRTVQKKDKSLDTRFVSAAHCVSGDSDKEQKQEKFYISADKNGIKTFIPVEVVEVGDKKQGDDFVILEAKGQDFHLTPLGDSDKTYMGESVIGVSAPFGLGKEYYQGYVSNVRLDRPPLDAGGVKWTELELVSIGGGPGSSGSSIVSVDQRAITGFLVGRIPGEEIGFMCVPVNKFKRFEAAVDAGTYKKITAKDHLSGDDRE
jgi:hypothetical protein